MGVVIKKPVIGITTYGRNQKGRFHLPGEYVDAVRNAGGIPLLLPPGESRIRSLWEIIDGLILAGGGDIDPAVYKGKPHTAISGVDPERDRLELELARQALNQPNPVLGICRGQQILNVATGGDLIEHLPDHLSNPFTHRGESGEEVKHLVQIKAGSRLAKIIIDTELRVISKHHQGIGNVSTDWEVVARASDEVIEAQEHLTHPWMIGVQWHPELSFEEPQHLRIFQALIDAAGNKSGY